MTSLNAVELEFFELAPSIRETITEEGKNLLLKKLLKLNNPTYYVKHITKNPIERHGFSSSRTTNPLLISISRMIALCKTCSNLEQLTAKLQQEFAWAYHKFPQYKQVDL